MADSLADTTPADVVRFRHALAAFPSGVTIVTTGDRDGRWWGFTATSFCSLSIDPPLVLVCLAKTASCHEAFLTAGSWVVHVVPAHRSDLARRFGTSGIDKFAGGDFEPDPLGNPVFSDAAAILHCDTFARHDGGDHTILVGRVTGTSANGHAPTVYFHRAFHVLDREAPTAAGGARDEPVAATGRG